MATRGKRSAADRTLILAALREAESACQERATCLCRCAQQAGLGKAFAKELRAAMERENRQARKYSELLGRMEAEEKN